MKSASRRPQVTHSITSPEKLADFDHQTHSQESLGSILTSPSPLSFWSALAPLTPHNF